MKIYFMRHGESEHNESDTVSSWIANPPLSKKGELEAEQAREEFCEPIVQIWCADFLRHKQTCSIFNKYRILPVTYTPFLRERDFGSLHGMRLVELKRIHPTIVQMDINQQYDYRPFGGESFDDVDLRVTQCIENIKTSNTAGDDVLAITSAGVIRLLYKKYKNISLGMGTIPNCSIHLFSL